MRLTRYSDYALRTLLYVATNPERTIPISEMARYYEISQNHLAKVVNDLVQTGLLKSTRGRVGGVRLALPPAEIRLGQTICSTEPDMKLIDCMGCVIAPVCGLPAMLGEAMDAFVATLDRYTLADLAQRSGLRPTASWNVAGDLKSIDIDQIAHCQSPVAMTPTVTAEEDVH